MMCSHFTPSSAAHHAAQVHRRTSPQVVLHKRSYTQRPSLAQRTVADPRQHQAPCRRRRQDYRGDAGEDKWGDGWTTAPTSTLVSMDFAGKRLKGPTWKGWSQATRRAFPSHFIYVYERQIKCKWSEWAPRQNKQSLDCWNHNVFSLEREILYINIKKNLIKCLHVFWWFCASTQWRRYIEWLLSDPEAAAQTSNAAAKIKCKGLTIILINHGSKSSRCLTSTLEQPSWLKPDVCQKRCRFQKFLCLTLFHWLLKTNFLNVGSIKEVTAGNNSYSNLVSYSPPSSPYVNYQDH